MKPTLHFLGVVALLAAAIPASLHAQTNAPRITSAGRTNGVFSLAWTNAGTNGVTIERRTALTSGSWTAIASNNTVGSHSDTNASGGAAFYRVRMITAPPPPPDPAVMALIPAGSFSMGDAFSDGYSDELPVHTVNVSAFYMDKYEVSKALWDEVVNWAVANGYDFNAGSAIGKAANHPAYSVSWYEAVKWCNARSEREGLTPCYTVGGATYKTEKIDGVDCNFTANGYRLPTEAEWEKAARGGLSGQRFPWGDTITHSQANYYSATFYFYDVSPTLFYHPTYATGGEPYTSPVGSFGANEYGVYDMAGNVSEWCWDRYSSSYYASSPSNDPRGPSSGSDRVIRNSGWGHDAWSARVTTRSFVFPDADAEGFRCARSAVP